MHSASNSRGIRLLIAIVALSELPQTITGFHAGSPLLPLGHHHHHHQQQFSFSDNSNHIIQMIHSSSTKLSAMDKAMNDDVKLQLAKAKELLELTKAKLAAQEEANNNNDEQQPPSMVLETSTATVDKRTKVTKSTNEDSGLITTDGELMAMLSEEEDWEVRSLLDVFEDELEESDVSKQLRKRDVAGSIAAMRLRMHGEDYLKIFNTKSRWIGEY